MREVWLDDDTASVNALTSALTDALGGGPCVLPLDPNDPAAPKVRAAAAPERPVEPDTAVIVPTSGSTGEPKGVLLSAAALIASANATHDRLGGTGRWLLATPAKYIGGLQVLVRAILAGHPAAALPPGGFRPDSFADAALPLLSTGDRCYTALVPTQLARLLDDGGRGLAAARAFHQIVIGAAATSATLRDRAAAAGVAIVPAYGMSETASGCVYDGSPLSGVRARLGANDRIELSGPVLAHGYRRHPELTKQSFVDGWFRTGDRGGWLADGRLNVLGRLDDVINTGGVKVAAAAVENELAAQPGVREVCVVGLPDPEWGECVTAVIVPAEPLPDIAELRAAVRAALGAPAVPKRVYLVESLPMRGPGKIDRNAVRRTFSRQQPD